MSQRRDFAGFHTRTPNEARVVDYLLGGKDNFAADREAAEQAVAVAPELPMMALESRRFLGRVVRFLAGEGVRQFVDIGCGLPTQNNAHEVAQAAEPQARVVYVDFDPVVVTHARAILADDVRTSVVQADMRDPGLILGHPDLVRLIDLREPVAILLVSALQAIPEDEVALDIVTRLREAICPGSWMVISHPVSDSRPDVTEQLATMFQNEEIVKGTRRRANVRAQAEIEPYFDGLDLAPPGIVRISAWRPDGGTPAVDPETVWTVAGVGRKP
ncbi:SAM-dependent methyltransferase [Actinoallomurus acaciae]|uniref:SAM-dependent methyltransferase n=1 Tax=Actinoallomurus acaciae TaxID=502577 RepID=A0ABV5YWW7_9ACTN